MFQANDINGNCVFPEENIKARCPDCNGELYVACVTKGIKYEKVPYFGHLCLSPNCHYEPETFWHRDWKKIGVKNFGYKNEYSFGNERRADLYKNNRCIEFQNSETRINIIEKRNKIDIKNKCKTDWIFNFTESDNLEKLVIKYAKNKSRGRIFIDRGINGIFILKYIKKLKVGIYKKEIEEPIYEQVNYDYIFNPKKEIIYQKELKLYIKDPIIDYEEPYYILSGYNFENNINSKNIIEQHKIKEKILNFENEQKELDKLYFERIIKKQQQNIKEVKILKQLNQTKFKFPLYI